MWIGYLSAFHNHWNTENETAKYLEKAGHKVSKYLYNDFDAREFLSKNFDIVLTALPQCQSTQFWESVRPPKVAMYYDIVNGWQERENVYIPPLKYFDLVFSTDGFHDWYAEHGVKRIWMPHGFDPEKYKPVKSSRDYECSVAFIGHVYLPRREQLLKGLEKFGLRVFGEDNTCWGTKYARICNSAKIVVGDNALNDLPGYWSDRLYLSVASGAFLLYPNIPGIQSQFVDGKHLVLYDGEKDLHQKIIYYLGHGEERCRIAKAGAKHAKRWHTMSHRIDDFMTALNSALSPIQIGQAVSESSAGNSSSTYRATQSSPSLTRKKVKRMDG